MKAQRPKSADASVGGRLGTWVLGQRTGRCLRDGDGVMQPLGTLCPVFIVGKMPEDLGRDRRGNDPADVDILAEDEARARIELFPSLRAQLKPTKLTAFFEALPEWAAWMSEAIATWDRHANGLGRLQALESRFKRIQRMIEIGDPTALTGTFMNSLIEERARIKAGGAPASRLTRLSFGARQARASISSIQTGLARAKSEADALAKEAEIAVTLGRAAPVERAKSAARNVEALEKAIEARRADLAELEAEAQLVPITRMDEAVAAHLGVDPVALQLGQRCLAIDENYTATLFSGHTLQLLNGKARSRDPADRLGGTFRGISL
jgi:hypothetical protein